MPKRTNSQTEQAQNVVAAHFGPGATPVGAENDPVIRTLRAMGDARTGRSDAGNPLPATDRPTIEAFRQIERENRLLIDHAEMLACALGACPDCWGTIEDCTECGGDGRPGWFEPEPSCFAHFVQPMLDRLLTRRQVEALFDRSRVCGNS